MVSLNVFLHRNSLGRNDNPNAIEFKSAFRKLLVCHPITTCRDSNAITNATGILTVPSTRNKMPKISSVWPEVQEYELGVDYDQLMLEEISTMDLYQQHLSAYLALCIEQKFEQNIQRNCYKCDDCAAILRSKNYRINDDLLAMKCENGPANQPLESTFKMVIFAEAVMKTINSMSNEGNNIKAIYKTVYNNLDVDDLYAYADFIHEEESNSLDHKEKFISEV